ncbi:DUF6411 family protein [Streptomyces sp. NPDC059651]|uniref:DUF6411 family protein n=1 Tax=unclassified Streptomyces TaxID=2593676 RepID=UPI003691FF41
MIAGVVALRVVLALVAFLVPRLSHHPQRGTQRSQAHTPTSGVGRGEPTRVPFFPS